MFYINKELTSKDKWVISLIVGLLFFIVASPFLFNFMNTATSAFGLHILNDHGCQNVGGLLLHSIIFILLIRILMR